METRPIDPSILADLPPAVAALPIELRQNGDRLILNTDVCKLLGVGSSGLRRLVERGKIRRAETAHNKAWYHASDVAALYRERHPENVGIGVTGDVTEALTLPREHFGLNTSDATLQALTEAVQRFVQAQASTIESLSATNSQLAGSNADLTRTCAELTAANTELSREARDKINEAAQLRVELAQEQARREILESTAAAQAKQGRSLLSRLFGPKA
jgi:hypothetical protein